MTTPVPKPSVLGRGLLALALGAALFFGSRGIADEGSVSMHGDAPRYLMNGVFIYDFLTSGTPWTRDAVVLYAERYFARYPALSIGHHPPLLPVTLVPFYAVFGVSVWAARLAMLSYFLLAVWLVYKLGVRLYDEKAAGWAALLFATNHFVVRYGQIVMSEMPSVAMSLLALYLLFKFCDTGRARHYAAFVAATIVSLCAKQLAALLFPVYLLVFATSGRWRRLQRRDIMIMTSLGALLISPVAIATLLLSPFNVSLFGERFLSGHSLSIFGTVLDEIVDAQMTPALLLAMAAACVTSWLRRDRTIGLSIAWIVAVLFLVIMLVGPLEPARYAMLASPAYPLCAAALAFRPWRGTMTNIAVAVLTFAVGWNVYAANRVRPVGGHGYEAVAEYVLSEGGSPTILVSDQIDSGYFVFFVRKHDPEGRTVVLRSDKLLTTTLMAVKIEERVHDPEEMYALLREFGTRFLVVADRQTDSPALEMLRREVASQNFREIRRFPIVSRDTRLEDEVLVVYEYGDHRPPHPNAAVNIRIPLLGREINIPIADLVSQVGP